MPVPRRPPWPRQKQPLTYPPQDQTCTPHAPCLQAHAHAHMHTHTCGARPDILIPHRHYHTQVLLDSKHSCWHSNPLFTHARVHTHTLSCTYSPFDLKHSCSHPTSHTHMPLSGLTHTHAQTHRLETHQNHCGQRSLKNDRLSVVPRGGGHPEA